MLCTYITVWYTTIHCNATQSGLHGFRVRPQRSGTVVMRHDAERTVRIAYIFGFIVITKQTWSIKCKFQSGKEHQLLGYGRFLKHKENKMSVWVTTRVSTQMPSCVWYGDCSLKGFTHSSLFTYCIWGDNGGYSSLSVNVWQNDWFCCGCL